MAYRVTMRAQSMSAANPVSQKLGEDPVSNKNAQSTVTCVYQTHIGGYWRNVTVLWSKNLMNHSLNISVDSMETDFHQSCKIDLKPWHFWAKKGYKTFEVDGLQVDAYWDLRSAKFSSSPEPCTEFYVALACEEEVVLLLGDLKKKAYKRTKSRPALVEAILFYKKEHVFGKKCFTTRAKFDHRKKDNEIVVESSTSGPRDPEMWISIDGIVMIHIRNSELSGDESLLLPWFQDGEYNDDGNEKEQDDCNHHAFSGFLLQVLCCMECICSHVDMIHCICHKFTWFGKTRLHPLL